jgi:hypothetical protein
MLRDPFGSQVAVFDSSWELVFWCEPTINRDHSAAGLTRKHPTEPVVSLDVTENPGTAVEIYQSGRFMGVDRSRNINADRQPTAHRQFTVLYLSDREVLGVYRSCQSKNCFAHFWRGKLRYVRYAASLHHVQESLYMLIKRHDQTFRRGGVRVAGTSVASLSRHVRRARAKNYYRHQCTILILRTCGQEPPRW